MSDLWQVIESDYALGQTDPGFDRDGFWRNRMAKYEKAEVGSSRERADWVKDVYNVKLVRAEIVENPYYRDAVALTKKYGEPVEGYWTTDKDERIRADFPEDAHQWRLTIEVLDGEKKGDWLWAFASPRLGLKKDGGWWGRAAAIISAIDATQLPDGSLGDKVWALTAEDAWGELMELPFRVSVEPKKDPQYGKVNDWLPMKAEDKKAYDAPVEDEEFGDPIPF